MATSTSPNIVFRTCFSRRLVKDHGRKLSSFLPVLLAFSSSILLLFYVSSTSEIYSLRRISSVYPRAIMGVEVQEHLQEVHENMIITRNSSSFNINTQRSPRVSTVGSPLEKRNKNDDTFHDESLFMKEYKEMNKSLKIYAYPHNKNDPFANVLLPVDYEPGGNYASESYFKKSLYESHFFTNDPLEADLFFLPFSIAGLRNDKRVGVGGIQDFVKNYVHNISRFYPFWNRTGGADHFYVACHSVGRTAMMKAVEVKINAIQVVCSSSYFLPGYVAHKDASVPQIWPRKGTRPTRLPSERTKLAFYAGAMNSRAREFLVTTWENDTDISVHQSRLKTPYSEALLESKFCVHAKGFEVNTARIGDALYYGCVPVILADHYDLPYADILNWNTFSVVVSTMDIPMLKKILLQEIDSNAYLKLQRNVMRVQKHFEWHNVSVDYDAFHMVMYELWLRRSHVRIS
ncbi:hypothetical protein BUALT_Bualt09G0107800 [Buddleja alternifolia]|uniref:Exostosin GT47 domain-containing protein n=1 Tax=Buddleja alternifolia TaxID=168488 RepID=A0AAV6XCI1_9LAMI|nr:hypothetical protein BUALT_Bualt09G0107800 [Buddleja alternifolia]